MLAVDRSYIMSEMGLAVYRGHEIPEIGVIADRNSLNTNTDIHFGMNKDMAPVISEPGCPAISEYLKIMGPRSIDITNRGGRIAEATWHYFNYKWSGGYQKYQHHPEVSSVGTDFRSKAGKQIEKWNKTLVPKSLVYPYGAKLKGVDISGNQRYTTTALTKWDIEDPLHIGTRWSKSELYLAVKAYGSIIHFHLDGMGDIHNVVTKLGNYNYNVTGQELRFVFRFWLEFNGSVHFYNGYDQDFNVVEVECPWKNDGSFTLTKVFT